MPVTYLYPVLFCWKYALMYDMLIVVVAAFKQPFPSINQTYIYISLTTLNSVPG
jgi:hypothetical protein